MKVIFLDFDGVINNWNCFNGVCEDNILYLKKIIEATGALVVVTSLCKYSFQRSHFDYLKSSCYLNYIKPLNELGIEIFDYTPYIAGNRYLEIKQYLLEYPEIDEYVILDDEFFSLEFKEHIVFLELYRGILEEHVGPAIDILNGKLGGYPKNFQFEPDSEKRLRRIHRYYQNSQKY